MSKYLNNSDSINISLICNPNTNSINKDIVAIATVKSGQSLIPGATVYFSLVDNSANTPLFKNNGQATISAITNSFGQARAVFSDKAPTKGKISVSLDKNFGATAAEADYQFVDDNILKQYLIFRDLQDPSQLAFSIADSTLTQFSESEKIPSVNIGGSGKFVAFLKDKRPVIIYIDKNDSFLKTTSYNGDKWVEPTKTIKTSIPSIATIGQIEILRDSYEITCTRANSKVISILSLTQITNDEGYIFKDIKDTHSLSWASSLEREWSENSKDYYIKSYHGVVPGQKIAIFELYGHTDSEQKSLARYTSAGDSAEYDGTFALRGNDPQGNKRADILFFQYNEDFGVINITVNEITPDKDLELTRTKLPISDTRIQPKEGVTAAYDSDGEILSFGLDQDNFIIIMHIETSNNNSDIYINKYTNTNIKARSSYIYLL